MKLIASKSVIIGAIVFTAGKTVEIPGDSLTPSLAKALARAIREGTLSPADQSAKRLINLDAEDIVFGVPDNHTNADGMELAYLAKSGANAVTIVNEKGELLFNLSDFSKEAVNFKYDTIPTDGQDVFTVPYDIDVTKGHSFFVNGISYLVPEYKVMDAKTIQWFGSFPLDSNDRITFNYYRK